MHCFLVLVTAWMVGACDRYNYTDDLQGLGKRVEYLEQLELCLNSQVAALHELIMTIEEEGYVTSVRTSPDGTCVITFNNGGVVTLRQGRDGLDGRDGQGDELLIGVKQDADGSWYWTVNGEPLTDADGEVVPAGAKDGRDGRDGRDGKADASVELPRMHINNVTRHWEVSTDGGKTWEDTGVVADGSDGADDLFAGVEITDGGKAVIFRLRDGRTFTVPLTNANP